MFKRILVPLDGTATAERAIPVAAQLAHAMGGVVVLLRVVHTAAGPHAHLLGSIIEAELTEAEHYLTGIATWPMLADSTTATDVVFGPGEVALTILSRAHAYHVDLIVMCSQTHSGLWSRIWGSIAEWVAYTASVPVLLLRDRGSLLIGHVNAFHPLRALVALDGSRQAEEALMPTASLIAALTTPARGVLHLVRVIQESPGGIEQRRQEPMEVNRREHVLREAKAYLGMVAYRLHERMPPGLTLAVTWAVVPDGRVAEALIKVAEEGRDGQRAQDHCGCDLIVMATHRHSRWPFWLKGGVLARVHRATQLPLLVVPSSTR